MKTMEKTYKFFSLAAVFSVCLLIANTSSAQMMTAGQLADSWKAMGEYSYALTDAMPAEHFGWTPIDPVMTFAKKINHVSGSNYGGWNKDIFKIASPTSKKANGTTKEQVLKDIKDSYEYIENAMRKLTTKDLEEEVEFFAGKMSRLGAILWFIDHAHHARGQMVIYLRLKGIQPPQWKSWSAESGK